jgi:nicotinamidase-related amidase
MQRGNDKLVYTTTEEILDPSHTALVVWDTQNLLVDRIFNKQEFMHNLISSVELARKSNVPVFFTRIQMLPTFSNRTAFCGRYGSCNKDKSK